MGPSSPDGHAGLTALVCKCELGAHPFIYYPVWPLSANIDAALVIFPEELLDNEAIPYHPPTMHVQLYHIEPFAVDVAVPFFLERVGRHSPNAASNGQYPTESNNYRTSRGR